MQCTIDSYKALIEQLQATDKSESVGLKAEMVTMQKEQTAMGEQRQKLQQLLTVKEDEILTHQKRITELSEKNDNL